MTGPTLITGAAGFAGSHLVERLAAAGVEVIAWHRPGGTLPPNDARARFEAIDLQDPAAVRDAIARSRPGIVYHCAGAAHVGRSWNRTTFTFAVNVRGTHYLLEALRHAALACHVLIPSSAMVYRSADEALTEQHPLVPESPYGLSKLAQELLGVRAMRDGIEVTIARSFNHVGPRQEASFSVSSFARQIAEIESGRRVPELRVGNLDARRDLTDVRDTVRAYTLIVERGRAGRPYNVCSGRALPVRDVLDRLLAHARAPITVRVDPERYRPNDIPLLLGDPTRIMEEIGWRPEIPIEQTLLDVLEYWRSIT